LLTKWLVDISINSISDNNTIDTKQRNQVAEPIRALIESIITKTAKEHYTDGAQQNILNLNASQRVFLQSMMDHTPWRKLLIDLSASFPNSPLLTYCLKEISKRGHHREIAKRIQNQSDYFDVFHGMLVSELCRIGNTAVNGSTFNSEKGIVKQIKHDDDDDEHEWDIDMEIMVEDLKRACSSSSYTYVYTVEVGTLLDVPCISHNNFHI